MGDINRCSHSGRNFGPSLKKSRNFSPKSETFQQKIKNVLESWIRNFFGLMWIFFGFLGWNPRLPIRKILNVRFGRTNFFLRRFSLIFFKFARLFEMLLKLYFLLGECYFGLWICLKFRSVESKAPFLLPKENQEDWKVRISLTFVQIPIQSHRSISRSDKSNPKLFRTFGLDSDFGLMSQTRTLV